MKSQNQTVKILSQLMAVSFMAEILMCWKLWFPIDRGFPMISSFRWLDFSIGVAGDCLLSFALLISLLFIAIDRRRNPAIIMTLGFLLILILEDVNRFQPWVYTQGAILVLILFNREGREKATVSGALLVVAFMYMWSGIQKFNLGFLQDTFPWMLSAFGFDFQIPVGQTPGPIHYLFILVPIIELSMGLFLLVSKTRNLGIIAGLIMHSFVLLSLGPTGHNWNRVVWPWNLSLMLFLLVYYSPREPLNIYQEFKSYRLNYIVLVLFGLLPVLNFFGYWDDTLSGALYSGTQSNVVFYYKTEDEPELARLTKAGTSIIETSDDGSISKTWFMYWSVYDIQVPFYHGSRYYSRFGRVLCEKSENPKNSGIEIIERSKFTAVKTVSRCSCLELLESGDR
jgi:hypothetical protein